MFLHVGSGINDSTMSGFSTRIKAKLHILRNFSKMMVVEFDASTSFCGWKSRFDSWRLFIHGASTSKKELDGFKQQFVTPARFADRGIPGHGLGKRSQTESECWKTETEIGTPARVEAETWNFARQRKCSSRALGTRVVCSLELLSIATEMVFPGERKPFPFHFAVRVSRADSQLTCR